MSTATRDQIPQSESDADPSTSESSRRGDREKPSRQWDNSRSSLFEKLPPELRRAVNVAIIEHCPASFKAIWMEFELGKYGVSFYSLYRYARRLRERVNLAEAAGLAAEDDPGLDVAIEKLAARRLFALLLDTDGAELNKEVTALLAAHSRALKTRLQDRRDADRSRLDWARLEQDRDQLRLKAQLLQSARDGVLKLLDNAKQRHSPAASAAKADSESRTLPGEKKSEPRQRSAAAEPSGSAE